MAVKTKKAIGDDVIADLIDSCTTNGKLDVEKFVDWGQTVVGRIARRVQKKAQNDSADIQAFVQANATAYRAFREKREADRIAAGDSED